MAQALWWPVAWCALAAAVSGARYADYSGVKMPQYGGGADYEGPRDALPAAAAAAAAPDDYADHPPDAPASPVDYKYDDDSGTTEKTQFKDDDETDWPKIPKRRQIPPRISGADNLEPMDKYVSEKAISKFKSGHWASTRQSQNKVRIPSIDDNERRYTSKYSRNRLEDSETDVKDDIHIRRYDKPRNKEIDLDDLDAKDDPRYRSEDPRGNKKGLVFEDIDIKDDIRPRHDERKRKKGLEFEEEDIDKEYIYKATTIRVARRKPRDRFIKRPGDISEGEDDMWQKHLVSANRKNFEPYPSDSEKLKVSGRRRFDGDSNDERDDSRAAGGDPRKDFGSVDGDQDRLAVIGKSRANHNFDDYKDYSYDMKRVAGIRDRLPTLVRRTSTAWRSSAAPQRTLGFQDEMWMNRRAMVPFPKEITTDSPTSTTESSTTVTTTTTTTESTSTSPLVTLLISSTDIADVLSLAEKSRLSILKKSQKKESEKGETTRKPVVLMHVTRQMHTLVMVEPPTSVEPWMRAKVVSGDSAERLKKVKRLMRQKLVENAKSIHDLTENWDEMVCDYVDTALIDNMGNTHFISWFLLPIVLLILCYYNVNFTIL